MATRNSSSRSDAVFSTSGVMPRSEERAKYPGNHTRLVIGQPWAVLEGPSISHTYGLGEELMVGSCGGNVGETLRSINGSEKSVA
ncbi:Uu.00g134750.m01.CDS01 [Anthostomella pinea]|uniref:Uu.00g134750.m01.CDS01 n=1 Tax=Anthostomella pinea TaxID=933095 RepID=A0AAI8YKZ2_9PEZI|nr:Uu.00g134750.m01.CDS01 [Anthostomella pinea]